MQWLEDAVHCYTVMSGVLNGLWNVTSISQEHKQSNRSSVQTSFPQSMISRNVKLCCNFFFSVMFMGLTIFNEGGFFTYKSIFHKRPQSILVELWSPTWICFLEPTSTISNGGFWGLRIFNKKAYFTYKSISILVPSIDFSWIVKSHLNLFPGTNQY